MDHRLSTLQVTEQNVQEIISKLGALKQEIKKIIVGQEETVDQLLVTFLAGGHALLEGVPGLAKTLMIRTLAEAIDLRFRRIQFTPDLMPSDIIGTEILEEDHSTGKRFFKFNKGPVFSNIILADEINRTSPKTQSALLEAMQEFAVTYAGITYPLERPFFILATQNPIEQAGTFPLAGGTTRSLFALYQNRLPFGRRRTYDPGDDNRNQTQYRFKKSLMGQQFWKPNDLCGKFISALI